MTDFRLKQGDTSPALVVTPVDEDKVTIPLLAAVSAAFVMRKPGETTAKVDAAADIDSGANTLTYQWQSGDTNEDGDFDGHFVVTWSDGTQTTFPNFRYLGIKVMDMLD